MTNQVLTNKSAPGIVAKLAAAQLADQAMFIKTCDKEDSSTFGQDFKNAQPGDTIYVKKPARFTVGSSFDLTSSLQDIVEEKVPLTLNKVASIGITMNSLEIAYNKGIKKWNDDILKPAMNALAANLDQWALAQATAATNALVGIAGTQPGAIKQFSLSRQKLVEQLCPKDDGIYSFINPATNTETVDARKGLLTPTAELSKIYREGAVGQGQGQKYVESNLLTTYTNGTATGSVTVTTTSTTGDTTIALTGTSSQTLTLGQVFTISSVFDVHPLTKQTLGTLKQFVVLANNTASSGAFTGVQISPTIYGSGSGALQNVSALPQSGATVTIFGAASTVYPQNLTFHKKAMRFCFVPLFLPEAVDFKAMETVDGISVAVIRDFIPLTRTEIMRFDVLAGAVAVRPEWMCRISG